MKELTTTTTTTTTTTKIDFSAMLLLLLIAAVPLVFIESINPFFPIKEFLFFGTAVLVMPFYFSHPLKIRKRVLLLFFLTALVPLVSGNPSQSQLIQLLIPTCKIFFLLAMAQTLREHICQKYALRILLVTTLIVSLYALLQYYGFNYPDWKIRQGPLPVSFDAVFSTLGNPNYIASFLLLAFYPLLSLLTSETLFWRITTLIGVGLSFVALVISHSRSGWLALALTFCYFMFLLNKKKQIPKTSYEFKGGILLFLITVLVIFSTVNPLNRGSTLVAKNRTILDRVSTSTGSLNKRLLAWNVTLEAIPQKLFFGHGAGEFGRAYLAHQKQYLLRHKDQSIYWDNFLHTHNDYLEDLYNSGLFGFLVNLIFLGYFLLISYQQFTKSETLFSLSLHTGIVVYLIFRLISFPDYLPASNLLFLLLCAFVLANQGMVFVKKWNGKSVFFAVLLCFVSLFLIVQFYQPLKGDRLLYQSVESMNQGEIVNARKQALEALKIWETGYGHFLLGSIHSELRAYNRAIEDYKKAQTFGEDPAIQYNLGLLWMARKSPRIARTHFENALEIFPHYFQVMIPLAKIYFESNLYRDGVRILRKLARWREVVFVNGTLYFEEISELEEKAEAIYRDALAQKRVFPGINKLADGSLEMIYPRLNARKVSLISAFNKYDPLANPLRETEDGLWKIVLKDLPKGAWPYYLLIDDTLKELNPDGENGTLEDGSRVSILQIR